MDDDLFHCSFIFQNHSRTLLFPVNNFIGEKLLHKLKMTDAIAEARAKMIAKRFGGTTVSTGGKGSVRRKKKASNRTSASQSDAKLSVALKKLGATNIPGIEEVNFFKDDGNIINFVNPRVQASIQSNTFVISGPNQTKSLQEMLPSIVSQLGMDNIAQLQNIAAQAGGAVTGEADDDDDVPDLVEGNFEDVSEK
jgi:nascent polypeptide-associated complex subunit beta